MQYVPGTYVDFNRPITQIVFDIKCNQIEFSYYKYSSI